MANNRKNRNARKQSNPARNKPNETVKSAAAAKTGARGKPPTSGGNPLTVTMGHEELTIRQRYETLSIANDFFIAIWFLVGSILFLYPSLAEPAAWLFIIGSAQFLVRPAIRLAHHVHLQRIPGSRWEL